MTQYTTGPNHMPTGRDLIKTVSKASLTKKSKDSAKDAPKPIHVGAYSRYQIKSGYVSGVYMARAFPKPPTKARGLIAEATGETEEAAIAALHAAIDAREALRSENRRTDPHTGMPVPTSDEYAEALHTVDLTKPQRAMFLAMSLATEDGLAEMKVASAGGYKTVASANKALTNAGRTIGDFLSSEAETEGPSTSLTGTALIGFYVESEQEKKLRNWVLHPELCAAIRATT